MFSLLLLLFILVPALEIYLLISIGSQIGRLNTITIVVVTGIIGASLTKSQGLSILNRIQRELSKGALPADQMIQGLLVFGGGLLLLTPGFITDILGLSMVFPGTRHIIVGWLKVKFEKGIQNGNIFFKSTTFHTDNSFYTHQTYKDEFDKTSNDNVIEVDFTEKKNKE